MHEVVEREARPVTIHEIELLEAAGTRLVLRVRCSKGTYIRTLVEAIAKAAGTIAHTARLHRETVGTFRSEDMLDMAGAVAAAEAAGTGLTDHLLPADAALDGWPTVAVASADEDRFSGGQEVECDGGEGGLTRVYGASGRFLGIGESDGRGRVAPRRIFMLES